MNATNPISPFNDNISLCRHRAAQCRSIAKNSRTPHETDAWLSFAVNWEELSDAFDLEMVRNKTVSSSAR